MAFRGYHTISEKEESYDRRHSIIEIILDAGANANYCRERTKMTALHWLAHNNDRQAIQVLLEKGGNDLSFSYDNNLPIDIAGTTPSLASVDILLEFYAS